MELTDLVTQSREHYVNKFIDFVECELKGCDLGWAENVIQLGDENHFMGHLYRVDFIKNAGRDLVTFNQKNITTFGPISGVIGKSPLLIEQLQWDNVLIQHGIDEIPEERLIQWFLHRFAPHEKHPDQAGVAELIHSVSIIPNSIWIDFGTAKPEAFFELVEILDGASASKINARSAAKNDRKAHLT